MMSWVGNLLEMHRRRDAIRFGIYNDKELVISQA